LRAIARQVAALEKLPARAPAPAVPPGASRVPLKIDIALDKPAHVAATVIGLKVTYTNISQEPIELFANGLTTGHGFAGEEYRIVKGPGKWVFRFKGIDPQVQQIHLKPGQSWTRTFTNLTGDLIVAQFRDFNGLTVADGPFAFLPFQEPGVYTISLHYTSVGKTAPKGVFAGTLESNRVELTIRPGPK
jgi:hypothetical protein